MALTVKQKKVINFCHQNGGNITKKQAMELIDDYYYNGAKWVGDVLSRMVKAGMLTRVKPGTFKTGKGNIHNQPDLF
jgi:hypothetical protein